MLLFTTENAEDTLVLSPALPMNIGPDDAKEFEME